MKQLVPPNRTGFFAGGSRLFRIRKQFPIIIFSILAGLLLAGQFTFTVAQNPDPVALIKKAEERIKGKTSHGIFELTVTTPDYHRKMKMESWWVGSQKALIKMLAPKREQGNRTLKKGTEVWMYLRNTETTIKIPPSMMLQSWNGSDYTYDDLVRESTLYRDYNITRAGEDTVAGAPCFKLKLIPKPDAPVVWGKLLYWVRQKDYLPAKVEYFDEKGKLMRTMEFDTYRSIGGRKIPTRWIMHNAAKPGHSTLMKILKIQFDIPIPNRIFSLRELER